jgi:hypothetical protein
LVFVSGCSSLSSYRSDASPRSSLGVVGITAGFNEPANRRFTTGAVTNGETEELLDRWARWRHARVLLGSPN